MSEELPLCSTIAAWKTRAEQNIWQEGEIFLEPGDKLGSQVMLCTSSDLLKCHFSRR